MLKITRFTCENKEQGCVTDRKQPSFSFSLESDKNDVVLKEATLVVNGWCKTSKEQIAIRYEGNELKPFTTYQAQVIAKDSCGETATADLSFETGRLDTPWKAEWISDETYKFIEKKVSPKPMTFRKHISTDKKVASAKIYATAMGIYELILNDKKVGNEYFAPGFTSYNTSLQYQVYDVTGLLAKENTLIAVTGGGWAVGSFVFTRKNRVSADRQAILLEMYIHYEDGTSEVIKTDDTWEVTEDGNYKMADFYDGETYDATVDLNQVSWNKATKETLRISPSIQAAYGAPVHAQEVMLPISVNKRRDELVYDFGQNFAGVVKLKINGTHGQKIQVRHAEILNQDGSLNTVFLRTAKACATYICVQGEQEYSPKLTYMGFRYISVQGIGEADVQVSALVLSSDLERTGGFSCSNEKLNRLQENIVWSARSNFMDIPTDCPQRDERMGWTGDLAVFSPTACYNFDMSRFLTKWMKDVRSEQRSTGGIPNTVPAQGYGFPATMPTMAMDFWGDACILVPWAEYCARGDIRILQDNYSMMKKYVKACKFWAGLFSFGKHRYIWHTPSVLHFGDWVAPDVPKMSQWQRRSRWTATASLCNTSKTLSKIAKTLGENEDSNYYDSLGELVAHAYKEVFTDGNGRLKNEFQTAYVLPLYFDIFNGKEKENAVCNLVKMIEKSNYCIGTGFPGTPYILFVLADNGYADVAYKMLLNETCPSWLYEVRMGATTIWERWDGLDENGICPIEDDGTDKMISYNHYASGAVGDFLYRRIAGIESMEAGYRRFRVAPILGGDIEFAKSFIITPYGRIATEWRIQDDLFSITLEVPVGTQCELQMPDGQTSSLKSGRYTRHTYIKK